MAMIIKYTPPDDTLKTINFPAEVPRPRVYRGGLRGRGRRSFWPSGKALTVVHEQFFDLRIEVRGIKPIAGQALWGDLYTFWQEVLRGVPFEIAMDVNKSAPLTMSGASSQGSTVLNVTEDPTGFPTLVESGDRMRVEDAADEDKREFIVTKAGTAGPNQIPLWGGLHKQLDTGSKVFFDDHFPICTADQITEPLIRRPASRGAALWDFLFNFRTTA